MNDKIIEVYTLTLSPLGHPISSSHVKHVYTSTHCSPACRPLGFASAASPFSSTAAPKPQPGGRGVQQTRWSSSCFLTVLRTVRCTRADPGRGASVVWRSPHAANVLVGGERAWSGWWLLLWIRIGCEPQRPLGRGRHARRRQPARSTGVWAQRGCLRRGKRGPSTPRARNSSRHRRNSRPRDVIARQRPARDYRPCSDSVESVPASTEIVGDRHTTRFYPAG